MAKKGQCGRLDTNQITRLVRQITFRILPIFGFLLVVLSTGVTLVSTFSFKKPVPNQVALTISVFLLLLFLFFIAGMTYIHHQKDEHHTTEPLDPTTYRLQGVSTDNEKLIAHSEGTRNLSRSGTKGDLRRSTDTLRHPAPSLGTLNKILLDDQVSGRRKSQLEDIERSLSPASANFEPPWSSDNRVRNERDQAGSRPSSRDYRAYTRPDSLSPRSDQPTYMPGGGLARPDPAVMPPMRSEADSRRWLQVPIPGRPAKGSRERPNPAREAFKPSSPTSPDSTRLRPEPPQTAGLEQRARNKLSKPPTDQIDNHEREDPPSPRFREKSLMKNKTHDPPPKANPTAPISAPAYANLGTKTADPPLPQSKATIAEDGSPKDPDVRISSSAYLNPSRSSSKRGALRVTNNDRTSAPPQHQHQNQHHDVEVSRISQKLVPRRPEKHQKERPWPDDEARQRTTGHRAFSWESCSEDPEVLPSIERDKHTTTALDPAENDRRTKRDKNDKPKTTAYQKQKQTATATKIGEEIAGFTARHPSAVPDPLTLVSRSKKKYTRGTDTYTDTLRQQRQPSQPNQPNQLDEISSPPVPAHGGNNAPTMNRPPQILGTAYLSPRAATELENKRAKGISQGLGGEHTLIKEKRGGGGSSNGSSKSSKSSRGPPPPVPQRSSSRRK